MFATISLRQWVRQSFLVLTAGLALFAMFFGSGNLVFPVAIGTQAQENYPLAILGLSISGVILPIVGLLAVIRNKGHYSALFNRLTPVLAFSLPLLLQFLMGPLGVIPRCINVAYGGFQLVAPQTPLWLFSAVMCVIIWACVQTTTRAIDSVGKVLTPFLLLSLFIIVVTGVYSINVPLLEDTQPFKILEMSIVQGYQTMDMLAAFFFSTAVYSYLKKYTEGGDIKSLRGMTIKSCVIGGLLLGISYAAFIYLGAAFTPLLNGLEPQHYLGKIAHITLGSAGGIVVSICIGLACLTTALVLTRVFVDYIYVAFPNLQVKSQPLIIATILVSFLISTLEFNTIASYLGPLMVMIYPGLIILALTGLSNHERWERWSQPLVLLAFLFGALMYYFEIQ